MFQQREHLATVSDNKDPKKLGRIKVTCSALLGDEQTVLPGWVTPALQWGWFVVPDAGQQVTVIYDAGSDDDEYEGQSSITSANLRWKGATEFTNKDAENATPIPEEFTGKNYGKRRGFKTPRGHYYMFDDTKGGEEIQIVWAGGDKSDPKTALMGFNSDGSYTMQCADGSMIYANAKDGEFAMIHKDGHYISLQEDGISMVDANGNMIYTVKDVGINIIAAGNVNINANAASISAPKFIWTGTSQVPINVGNVLETIALGVPTGSGAPLIFTPMDGGATAFSLLKANSLLP